jgi:hypothetical protein
MAARWRFGAVTAVRAGWAVVLLVAPERVLRAGGEGAVTPAAVAAARVLGARHLVQAGVNAATGGGAVAALGAVVDALHATSCVGLAAVSPRWRRIAALDAVVEAGFAAADFAGRRHPFPRTHTFG